MSSIIIIDFNAFNQNFNYNNFCVIFYKNKNFAKHETSKNPATFESIKNKIKNQITIL